MGKKPLAPITITIVFEDESVQELFENAEIRFSKSKLNTLKKLVSNVEPDIQEQLEDTLKDALEEMITEEWGE